MSWIAKAALAAALLNCGLHSAHASDAQTGQWLKDGTCSLYNADAHPGDSVAWTGGCVDGYAEGLGTATFTGTDGKTQSFTGIFAHGAVSDGHVVSRWGTGWSYDGDAVDGVFNGAGILTTASADRFEGRWTDGKMNGFGILRRANGDRYAGDWKDDKPNGLGELRHADGSLVSGQFVDGKLAHSDAAPAAEKPKLMKASTLTPTAGDATAPFSSVSGKTLVGVDGSSIALNLIEGGMELQVIPADGSARKTTFTFMTDRMGTVVEDTGVPSAGSSVTGFFRLTGKGVEVRYADGRSTLLSSNGDGGVLMTTDGEMGPSCRNWYPAGHSFSDADKKAALNAYASRLGLPIGASDNGGCAAKATPASLAPAPASPAAPVVPTPAPAKNKSARAEIKAAIKLKPAARMAQASYHIGDYKGLESVAVKDSEVHAIDAMPDSIAATKPLAPSAEVAVAQPDKNEASKCLKVDSDGSHWGFRNSCSFAVQFAYCMAGSSDSLTGCGNGTVPGSVAAGGFGALTSDNSLKEKDVDHNFRWIACGGGAGEVVAHLDRFEPPAGRCERTRTASN